ncbi:MAG: D-glycerate dehydrogenase [Candidatus Microgenomates bacterium]|jgi:glyoxylate reductase
MKIFVTRQIPGDSLEKLKVNGNEVVISEFGRPLTPEELLNGIKGVDAVLSLLTDKIDGDVMDAAGPQLKIISNYAVGFDNVDTSAATKRGIIVTNTPSDEVNEAVAEHTWALILALARRIVEADEATRKGAYKGWEPDIFLGINVIGKTLGIIGMGRIGSMVARRAIGYKMNVLYNKHTPDPDAERELGVKFASLDELLGASDFVTLHVPLTPDTRHMINKDTFAKMKRGSFLVNTARGQVVNERDLVDALASAQLAGAALDVFDNEPDISPELIDNQRVITTPHIASATWEARLKMGEQAVAAILDTFSGTKPQNMVDEKVWDTRRK